MTERVLVRLEIEAEGNSLAGLVRDGSGAARAFSGWLGLVAAIDALLPEARPSLIEAKHTRPVGRSGAEQPDDRGRAADRDLQCDGSS